MGQVDFEKNFQPCVSSHFLKVFFQSSYRDMNRSASMVLFCNTKEGLVSKADHCFTAVAVDNVNCKFPFEVIIEL